MKKINSINDLSREIKTNPQLLEDIKADPVKAIDDLSNGVPDTFIYRIVVGSLGLAILLVIVGVVILKFNCNSNDIPTIFTAIASGAIGALAGLLAPTPSNT